MNKYMKMAINEATKGITNNHGGPFGSVIVKDGKVIAKGHNHVIAHNDPTCHGEVNAIRKACNKLKTFDLSGCELYTTSYPCPMCMYAMRWANIKTCYYGCNINDAEDIGFRDRAFYEDINISDDGYIGDLKLIEVDHEECLNLFEEYSKLNHTNY